jgi:hypothetical protein
MTPTNRSTIVIGSALLLQSATALLWAGSAAERLSQLERQVDNNQVLIERTARLEEQVAQMRITLERIDRRLEAPLARERTP